MDEESYSKEVAKGSFWSLLGAAFFKLSSFFYVILIARAASPDDVGIFYLAFGIIGLATVISDLGMPASLQRYVPYFEGKGEKRKIGTILVGSYAISGLASLALTVLVWLGADAIGAFYQNAALPDAMRLLSIYVFLNCIFRINTIYLQGRGDIKSMQFVSNAQNLLKLVLTLAAFHFYGASIITLTGAFSLSVLLAWLLSLPAMRRRLTDIPLEPRLPDAAFLRELVPFGFMLTVLGAFWVLIASVDKLFLGYLLSAATAAELIAIYSMAGNLAFVLTALPGSIDVAFFPIISRAVGKGQPGEIRSVVSTVQRWVLLVTIPPAIVMMLFAADILDIFYGDVYRAGAMVMALLTFAFLLKSVFSPLLITLAAKRLVALELKIAVAVSLANVILNLLLIPHYGIEGAALATLAGFVMMLFLLAYYSNRTFGFTISPDLLKIALAGVLAFTAVLLLKEPLSSLAGWLPALPLGGELEAYSSKVVYMAYVGLLICLSLAIFVLSAMVLKCLHPDDISLMRKIMARAGMPSWFGDAAMKVASYGVPKAGQG